MLNRLVRVSCVSYVVVGFMLVIVGAVLPELLRYYSQNFKNGGLLIFIQFIGVLAGVLSMPLLTRKGSRRLGVTLGFLLIACESIIFLLPPWPVIAVVVGLAGVGAGLVESCIGTIILLAAKEKQAIEMSKLEVTFGIGALVMPFIAGFFIYYGVWRYSFLLLGISAFLMTLAWHKLSFGEHDQLIAHQGSLPHTHSSQTKQKQNTLPVVLLCALFFFLYGGSEVSVVHFFPSIFIERWHIDSSIANITITLFWFAMVIGRVFCGILAERFSYGNYLRVSCGGALVALILLVFSPQAWSGFLLSFILGLFMSGVFAIALIYANRLLPGMTERTTSTLFAASGLGGSLVPILVGWFMDVFPTEITLLIYVVMMLALLLIMMVVGRVATLVSNQLGQTHQDQSNAM